MNNGVLNSRPINWTILVWDYLLDNISFDNYWLQNKYIITQWEGIGIRDYPDRRINLVNEPEWNWQIYNTSFFWGRTISLSWVIIWKEYDELMLMNTLNSNLSTYNNNLNKYSSTWKTWYDLDNRIDEFKLRLSAPNKKLKWRVNNEIREIDTTCENIKFWTKERIYIPFEATFVSQSPFWRKVKQSSYFIENTSNNNITADITNSLKEASPWFIFWIKSWSITNLQITSNNIWITINQTINSWDILYVNWQTQEVLLNQVDIDYDWIFPIFNTGSNQVKIDITWTYTADINIIWQNNLM